MIRINRLGVLALVAAAGLSTPVRAQVAYRDRWLDAQDAKVRAELQRLQQERTSRSRPSRMNDQMRDPQDRMYDQQERMRAQQERMRDQQELMRQRTLDRARDQRERELERAQEQRERTLERAREQQERARDQMQRNLDRAQEARERALERARDQQIDEFPTGRRVYITPPPNVHIKSRWP